MQALKRELKVKEIQVLDAARQRFLSHQQRVREAELHRMDSEIQRKVGVSQSHDLLVILVYVRWCKERERQRMCWQTLRPEL